MQWLLERRDEGWFVIAEDGSSEVFHHSRVDAIKHQRAMYANESRVASMYAELDARPEILPETSSFAPKGLSPLSLELMAQLLKADEERSLVASDSQALLAQQMQDAKEDRLALVAALGRMGSPVIHLPEPVVNVTVPAAETVVNVPPAEINVTVPAAEVTYHAPPVNVTVEAPQPVQKTVTFERDPLTQQVTKAEVTES